MRHFSCSPPSYHFEELMKNLKNDQNWSFFLRSIFSLTHWVLRNSKIIPFLIVPRKITAGFCVLDYWESGWEFHWNLGHNWWLNCKNFESELECFLRTRSFYWFNIEFMFLQLQLLVFDVSVEIFPQIHDILTRNLIYLNCYWSKAFWTL